MANNIRFAQPVKAYPVLAPADITTSATATQYVDLQNANWLTFVIYTGNLNNSTSTITVEASTAGSSNATEAAIPFSYRKSASGVGVDGGYGAVTAGTSSGISLVATDDNKLLFIDVDPAAVGVNPGADYRYVRLVVTPASDNTNYVIGASAFIEPRYPGNTIASVT